MTLPRNLGSYRIIRPSEMTEKQLEILRRAGRQRIVERLTTLIGDGKISLSQVQQNYGALMHEVGDA